MSSSEIEREKSIALLRIRVENLRFANWVVDLLVQFHKSDNFGLATATLREVFRKQIMECEANVIVLEAERDGCL